MRRHCVSHAAQKYWESSAISLQYLEHFGNAYGLYHVLWRANSFKWLLLHYALPIGFHLKGQVDDHHCVCCQL